MKRPRLRKWAKWACTVVAVLCIAAAVGSRFYATDLSFLSPGRGSTWSVAVGAGVAELVHRDISGDPDAPSGSTWEVLPFQFWDWGIWGRDSVFNTGRDWRAGLLWYQDSSSWALGLSLTALSFLTSVPAAFVWYADRRRFVPGSCRGCGYDRAGLAPTNPCPECGTVATRASR